MSHGHEGDVDVGLTQEGADVADHPAPVAMRAEQLNLFQFHRPQSQAHDHSTSLGGGPENILHERLVVKPGLMLAQISVALSRASRRSLCSASGGSTILSIAPVSVTPVPSDTTARERMLPRDERRRDCSPNCGHQERRINGGVRPGHGRGPTASGGGDLRIDPGRRLWRPVSRYRRRSRPSAMCVVKIKYPSVAKCDIHLWPRN